MADRYRVKLAVYLLLRRGDEVLLLKRQNTGYMDGKYGTVGGHVEEDEPAELAMVREAKEEAGIDIDAKNLRLVYVTHRVDLEGSDDYGDLYFETDTWQGEITNAEPQKCSELTWVSIHDLPDEIAPYVGDVIRDYLNGGNYKSLRREA